MSKDSVEDLGSSRDSVRFEERHEFTQEIIRRLRRLEWTFAIDDVVTNLRGFGVAWIKHGGEVYCITRGSYSGEWDAVVVPAVGETSGDHSSILTSVLRTGTW